MEDVRIRLPELLAEHEITAHRLSVLSGGKLALPTVYRLVARQGAVKRLDSDTLNAIVDALGLKDMNKLISRDPPPPRVARKRRKQAQSQSRAA